MLEFSPSAGMNVIYGENAQGKTNLLEGIYVLSTLKSFRTHQLSETVQFGEAGAFVCGTTQSARGKHELSVGIAGNEKQPLIDRKKADATHYLGVLNVFLFSYPMLEVIRGGPEERRRFIDRSIAMSKPGYLPVLMQYHRAMKQKNALLMRAVDPRGGLGRKEVVEEIISFNQQLLESGLEIAEQRKAYLDRLQELLRTKQQLFFEKDLSLELELSSSFLTPRNEAQRMLEKMLDREMQRGICLVGVHRDEIRFRVEGKELRKFGSSGQHRAFLLLMLLVQLELYEQLREDRPILLLDDLDSELDQSKILMFIHEIRNRYQTLISSSRKELFSNDSSTRFYGIKSGELLEM